MNTAIRALTESIYPRLQYSKPFEQIMLKITRGLLDDMDRLPPDNDIIKHANKLIADNPDTFIMDHHIFASYSKHDVMVLEYILAEIIELSGNVISDNNKRRLLPMSVVIAIHNDADLNDLVKTYIADYIPTLLEIKALGGVRWALHFMDGSDPYRRLERYENSKTIYPLYEEWHKKLMNESSANSSKK